MLAVLLMFAATAVLSFAIPLAFTASDARTHELMLSRTAVLDYFATLAHPGFFTGDADYLRGEIDDYYHLFGEAVLIADAAGVPRYASGLDLADPKVSAAIDAARRNEQLPVPTRLTPWSAEEMLLARPIGTGVHSEGVVVLSVSATRAQSDIARTWGLIAATSTVALALVVALAHVLTRWVLRPLDALSSGVASLTRTLPKTDEPAPLTDHYTGPPEIRDLARSFDAMTHSVLNSASAQRQLITDTAHKLRNPLAALQIRLDMLTSDVPETSLPSLDRAAAEAQRLRSLLDGMLKLAAAGVPERFELAVAGSGKAASCDAVLVAAERADSWGAAFAASKMLLTTEFSEPHCEVAINETSLEEILDAALSNAHSYAGAGAKVTISVRNVGETSEITVTDNGPGVPSDEIGRLTERFYRSTTQGQAGTGLGLSIAHALADAHLATLRVEPAKPHGLSVVLEVAAARRFPRQGG
ncbi:sensor histidine kinase [Hoyosella altamirensis]|uniref:sensor histidine kinase n=1 Tax=Hoyosella altamirensis TaxID=616997 RepID=UPI0018DE6A7F|nr:HAMP domain-containing sensor histidine kinase [Hoyosella altamirensis]